MSKWVRFSIVLMVIALRGTAFAGSKLNKFGVADVRESILWRQ
jgi:hypothetical protein